MEIHNIDISNMDIYDLIINTDTFNPEKVSEEEMRELLRQKDERSHDLRVVYDFLQTQKIESSFKEKKFKLKSK